jgi:hypothetical protein
MFVIDPGKESKFFPGFGNGPTIKIGKFGDFKFVVELLEKERLPSAPNQVLSPSLVALLV